MKRIVLAALAVLTSAVAFANDKYLDYPKRVDSYHNIKWPVCKGKLEAMQNCVVDGDTLRINYKSYRIGNLDTPETRRSACPQEKDLGNQAKDFTFRLVNEAKAVHVTVYIHPLFHEPTRDKYGRILASIAADDVDIATSLKGIGLARDYDGGTKSSWCN